MSASSLTIKTTTACVTNRLSTLIRFDMNRTLSFIFVALSLTLFASCVCDCECSERHGCRIVTIRKQDGTMATKRFCSTNFGQYYGPAYDAIQDSVYAFIVQSGNNSVVLDNRDSIYFEKGVRGLTCDETAVFERKGYSCWCAK